MTCLPCEAAKATTRQEPIGLTHSAIQKAKTCWKAYEFAYEMRLRQIRTSEALSDGATFHKALETFDLTPGSFDEKKAAGLAIIQKERSQYPKWCITPDDQYEWQCGGVKIAVMFGCHCDRYRNDGFEVIGTEFVFRVPIRNPDGGGVSTNFYQTGKIDRLVRLPDGRVAVQEYKSTIEDIGPDSDYWKRLRIDSQISTYMVSPKDVRTPEWPNGIPVETSVYDVSRKPPLRPYRATPLESRKYTKEGKLYANQREFDETPEEYGLRIYREITGKYDDPKRPDDPNAPNRYFRREEIVRLESDLRDHQHDVWGMQKMIRQAQLTGRYPRNTSACKNWYGKCAYFDICTGVGTVDPMNPPEGFEIIAARNPELEESAQG